MNRWNGHLEITCHPVVIENSRQYLLPRTNILRKTVVGCPWCLVKLYFETFAWLQSTEERNANWCGFDWKTIYVIIQDHFIHNAMKAWGKIGSSEKLEQQLYVFLEKVTFFSKLLSFTVVTSLVTNGFRPRYYKGDREGIPHIHPIP